VLLLFVELPCLCFFQTPEGGGKQSSRNLVEKAVGCNALVLNFGLITCHQISCRFQEPLLRTLALDHAFAVVLASAE
jgi:hypothetical protein